MYVYIYAGMLSVFNAIYINIYVYVYICRHVKRI